MMAAYSKQQREEAGLPTGATWAASPINLHQHQGLSHQSSDLSEQTMANGGSGQQVDTSDWPTLGMAAASGGPPPGAASGPSGVGSSRRGGGQDGYGSQGGFGDSLGDQYGMRRSPGGGQHQDLLDQNVPPHLTDAFATAQVGRGDLCHILSVCHTQALFLNVWE